MPHENEPHESDALLRDRKRNSREEYAFHKVLDGDRENKGRSGLRTAVSGEEEKGAPPLFPSGESHASSRVDTLRIDLQKVAYKLNIPLKALLKNFQSDPSSESCKKNRERDLTKLELPLGGDPSGLFQDPIAGTPLASPSLRPAEMKMQTKRSLNDSRDFGTTVLISNNNCESPNLISADMASVSASMASDENLKVELMADKRDEKLPHVAYLVHDVTRGATMMAIPNLPPPPGPIEMDEEINEPANETCCWCFDMPEDNHHESTSAIGEVSCFDFTQTFTGRKDVVKSVMLYSENGALYLQVQRRMPFWGLPCLLTGIVCSAFVPTLYRQLAVTSNGNHDSSGVSETVGSAASHVWWALGEFIVSSFLMLVMLKVQGLRWLDPWRSMAASDTLLSQSGIFVLVTVVADVARHISWSFIINDVAQGPTQLLHSSHPLWLMVYRAMSSSLLLLGEVGGSVLTLTGNILASQTLDGFSDWDPNHGVVAGLCSGLSTAVYLLYAHKVIANQPTVALVWLCKCVNMLAAIGVVLIKGKTSFFTEPAPFMGGTEGSQYVVLLAMAGIGRDVSYLFALKALHSLPVSTSMVVDAVLAILFSHWCLSESESFGELKYQFIVPGLLVAVTGMFIACYVGLKERTFQEVDLTSPELTRKAARPPPKLTSAALGVQQQRAKSNPPIMWEYSPPPSHLISENEPSPPIYPNVSPSRRSEQ